MADSMLVRFEDDLAKRLRDRARLDDKTITGFINDAVRTYLDQLSKAEEQQGAARDQARRRLASLARRLADADHAVRERTDVWEALAAVLNCVELVPVEIEDEKHLDPVTWEQFKYSRLNETGSDDEAQRMFARDYAEIEGRDWTWYLSTGASEEEAKVLWLRQRRRYGIPVPPLKPGE